jgi:general secretion pathway protein I
MMRCPPVCAGLGSPHGREGQQRHALLPRQRDGMTLLEVLVALGIFLLSMVAIGRLISISSERAREVQLQGEAMLKCQSKMAEIYAGVEQLSSQSDVPFTDDPNWHWSADCNQGQVTNLWTVQVRVTRQRADGSQFEATLSQMMLDPSIRGTTMQSSSASGSSSSSSSSGSTSGTSMGGP